MTNSWFELLLVLHMMGLLTLMGANEKLIPKGSSSVSERLVSPGYISILSNYIYRLGYVEMVMTDDHGFVLSDCMRDAVDLLLKAAGYLNFCVHDVLPHLPPEIKCDTHAY